MRSIITVTCRVIDTKIATTVNKTDHGKATPKQNTQHSSLNEKKIQVESVTKTSRYKRERKSTQSHALF